MPPNAEVEQQRLYMENSQVQILEMQSMVIEIINSVDGMNFSPDTTGKRIDELGETTEEFTHNVA